MYLKKGKWTKKNYWRTFTKLSTIWKTYKKAKNYLICCRDWETETKCIRRKSFISMLNARFVWEDFVYIATKEGWYGSSAKVSLNFCSLIFKPCRWNNIKYTKICMTTPDEIDTQIIDAVSLIHLNKDLTANFGGVAKYNFRKILQWVGKVMWKRK